LAPIANAAHAAAPAWKKCRRKKENLLIVESHRILIVGTIANDGGL
jgi:hypothetical protein